MVMQARRGCDVCHRVFRERYVYKYYPVRISHKTHAGLGIGCTFCHRGASSSTYTGDYLMPAGHNLDRSSEDPANDKNPCRVCHIYFSQIEKNDRRIPAKCSTCHPDYSDEKPVHFRWVTLNTNLINNHKTHYEKGIPCLRCHAGFDLVEDTIPNYIPKMDICTECHRGGKFNASGRFKDEGGGDYKVARRLFSQNCAMCHGPNGKGDGPVAAFFKAGLRPRDLTDSSHMAKRTDGQLYDVIMKGGPEIALSVRMPAWEGLLKEEEVNELVRYIRYISRQ